MKAIDPAARWAAIGLLARGIITIAEAAKLAGVSRQLMHKWVDIARVDHRRIRRRRIAQLWRRAIRKK